eukprot:scaffold288985_cov35-Tisochrysis_lutea.AAC.1
MATVCVQRDECGVRVRQGAHSRLPKGVLELATLQQGSHFWRRGGCALPRPHCLTKWPGPLMPRRECIQLILPPRHH